MAKNVQNIAGLLGTERIGQLPEAGGGAFGAARMAKLLHDRLTPSMGRRPGRPTDPAWVRHPKVPMTEETIRKLNDLAEQISTPERKVSPMQVAAQVLEQALADS